MCVCVYIEHWLLGGRGGGKVSDWQLSVRGWEVAIDDSIMAVFVAQSSQAANLSDHHFLHYSVLAAAILHYIIH